MRKIGFLITTFLIGTFFVLAGGGRTVLATGHLTLSPSTGSYNNGDNFDVTVGVDSGTDGSNAVDVWGTFDSSKLDVVSIVTATNKAFDFEMTPHFDNTTGKFDFSCAPGTPSNLGIAPIKGDLAVIKFKAKATGTANLNFTCASGSTIDSNIFNATASDVISCSDNQSGSYTINASSSTTTTTTTTAATATPTKTKTTTTATELPQTGGLGATVGLITFGLVSVCGAFLLRFL